MSSAAKFRLLEQNFKDPGVLSAVIDNAVPQPVKMVLMATLRLSFLLLIPLVCVAVGGKSRRPWTHEQEQLLHEDEVFWGVRGLLRDNSMSLASGSCKQIDVSSVFVGI